MNHEQIQQIACNIAAGNPSILATSGLRRNVYNGMKEVVKDNCCIIGGYLAACVKHRKRWMRANKRMLLVYTSETGICSERSRRHAKQIEMRRVLPRNYIIDCNTYIQHYIYNLVPPFFQNLSSHYHVVKYRCSFLHGTIF